MNSSNSLFVDAVRFLGHFQPQPGKPAIWELGSDQHHNVGKHDFIADEIARYAIWSCQLSLKLMVTVAGFDEIIVFCRCRNLISLF